MKEKGSDHAVISTEYITYLARAIQSLLDDGYRLPVIKKATNGTHKFQVTGHLHIADALQGYWERNKKIYSHRAKSDYRALYLGTILMLEEEKLMTGQDNDETISSLRVWLELKEPKHKILQQLSLLRQEIRQMLSEMDQEVLSEDEFQKEILDICKTVFKTEKERIAAAKSIDRLIEEETVKTRNRKYQHKHRDFEKIAKGLQVFNSE